MQKRTDAPFDREGAIARISEFIATEGPLAFLEAAPPADPTKLAAHHAIKLHYITLMRGLELPPQVMDAIGAAADFLSSITKEDRP